MSKLHVATSPLTGRVFCGTVLKSGDTWGANKTDVTGEACAAVVQALGDRAIDGKERAGALRELDEAIVALVRLRVRVAGEGGGARQG